MTQMSKTNKWARFIIYIYIFDLCMLPTFHIFGLPFKVSYLIAFLCVAIYLLGRGVRTGNTTLVNYKGFFALKTSRIGRRMILCVSFVMMLTILGEITARLMTTMSYSDPFRDAMFFYVVLLGSMIVGYIEFDFNKNYLVVILAIYCGINIFLSALGADVPTFFYNLYGIEASITLLGAQRAGGIFGNPNGTLCIMNVLFMCITVFIKRGEIKVDNKIKLCLIVLLPLITNCFLNSRGEFLVTAGIEAYLLYAISKQDRNIVKTAFKAIIIVVIIFVGYNIAIGYLSSKYPTVAYGIKRLFSIFNSGSTSVETDSFADRPFIHVEEFWDRFIKSPIWGTGFSSGSEYPFQRACSQYHNDWFRIIGSSGVLGLILWIMMLVVAVKKCGFVCLLPFFITAISNTFIASPQALGLYFILTMSLIRLDDKSLSESLV